MLPRYKTLLPGTASFYLLQECPHLKDTRIAAHIRDIAGGDDRMKAEILDEEQHLDVLENTIEDIHIEVKLADVNTRKKLFITFLSGFLAIQEDIQDAVLEECFSFAPLLFGPLVRHIPSKHTEGGGKGSIGTGIVLVTMVIAGFILFALYHVFVWVARGCPLVTRRTHLERLHTRRNLLKQESSRRLLSA